MLDTAVLSEAQRERYQRSGWVAVPGLVDSEWLERLRRVTDEFVDASRRLTESNILYDLDVGHSADEPRLRRLSSPTDLHETYWEFASQSAITDVAVDLLGADVKFHHSKLNFKAPRGGEEVKWHQDIQFWPHTNYDLLTIGVFLEDVEAGMGEVGFVPGSHDGPLFDLYDEDDQWTGALRDRDVEVAGVGAAEYPIGPAGTITVHNCRTVHGSAPNRSDRPRPLLLQTYAAADAFAYTDLVKQSPHGEELIRGEPARWARHDPRPCLMPPTGPYRPIFAVQQGEEQ
ncbi:MAG TPA: phytanoyl-CoA dioxygenase family protein [Acidimicrobiia bacterium]|jgi:ectoine hydroxylase-related dioxygenase (phytanoyl-CoA dioxygenase family)|nr:phytanoyl-CoA dioxygenase family protein [Acidimicrobiia bacterium]